jgi:hypothetical protein
MAFPQYKAITEIKQFGKDDNDYRPKCHAIIFKNAGDMRVKLNDVWVLEPGEETPTISTGHPEVLDYSSYKISFDPSGGGVMPLLNAITITVRPFSLTGTNDGSDACENF